ncbi:MAG: UvrD-helicase domain-containing protein, partial [Gemmatimonadaceae bacterium]|nr:UvrD-helicase domain-containing protein [Gemmatimonadaceae bacterium]
VGTFHAIGARMLRMHPDAVGRTTAFTIYDEDDTLGVVKRIMERRGISPKQFTPKGILGLVSDAKNALVPPGEYESLAMDPFSKAAAIVYRELEGELRRANAVTFDDLLVLPVQLLREQAPLRERYQQRFQYILVDEYQDTNRAQYSFIKLLAAHFRNVCVVGDDDQSIYGWRGADIRNILDFNKDFADAAVVRLEENYRSTPAILDIANRVISANTSRMGKTLRATRSGGEQVSSVRALDERDEADWVVDEVLARRAASRDLALRDVAVLYRTNAQSRALEESLRRKAIPYRLIGAVRFYDRREIRDLVSYLKLIANPADDEAFRRAIGVPKRGVGDASVELVAERARTAGIPILAAAARAEMLEGIRPATRHALGAFVALIGRLRLRAADAAVDELLRELVDAIRYGDYLRAEGEETAQDRLDNVRELITSAAETVADEEGEVGLTPLDHFLQRAMLVAAVDGLDPDADAVTLMTLHNAKGLEFPYVFITGLEDGLFPLARAFDDPALLEEERRLFYVGITRAERKLYLTYAEQRRRHGETLPGKPSSFLMAIPEELLDRRNTVKVRSSGRAFMSGYSGFAGPRSGGNGLGPDRRGSREEGGWAARSDAFGDVDLFPPSPAARRPGRPLAGPPVPAPGEESQDAAIIAVGSRVRHRKYGSGVIAEIAGSGRDTKVRVDFDDEDVGRKTLVVAQANLERGDE